MTRDHVVGTALGFFPPTSRRLCDRRIFTSIRSGKEIEGKVRVVEKFVTPARPDSVWRILADVEHWRDWTPTVVEITPVNGSGLTVGARYRVVQPKLRPAIYEVTECVPNQAFTWVQKLPRGAMIADHRLSSHDGGTEVELSFTSKGLLANIVGKMFSKLISDYVATEAKNLKSRCDSLAHR